MNHSLTNQGDLLTQYQALLNNYKDTGKGSAEAERDPDL